MRVSSNSVEEGFGGGIALYCAYGDSAGHRINSDVTYNASTSTSNDHIGGGGIFIRPRNCAVLGSVISNSAGGASEGGGGISRRVLLVDDETVIREVGRRMLEKGGYQVKVAANGEEALEIYRKERADVVLLFFDAAARSRKREPPITNSN